MTYQIFLWQENTSVWTLIYRKKYNSTICSARCYISCFLIFELFNMSDSYFTRRFLLRPKCCVFNIPRKNSFSVYTVVVKIVVSSYCCFSIPRNLKKKKKIIEFEESTFYKMTKWIMHYFGFGKRFSICNNFIFI